MQRALTNLIGYWNGAQPEGMTAADADAILSKTGATPESRVEVARIMQSIEATKYGSVAGLAATALVDSTEKLLPKLQREMEAKRS